MCVEGRKLISEIFRYKSPDEVMQSLEVYEKQFQAGEISWWDLTKKVMSHSIVAGIATANTMFPNVQKA
jgi:endonuclease III-like uncharacterized protein